MPTASAAAAADHEQGKIASFSMPKELVISVVVAALVETALNMLIIGNVQYTEIDWRAYMEQVEIFLGGERDYINIRGGTGPLVYPAGFLYIYSFFYYICARGASIVSAQLLFVLVYVSSLVLQLLTLGASAFEAGWPRKKIALMFLLMCISRRLHSLYVLRLFNDCIAMLLFHISLYLIVRHGRWLLGCVFFSLAISVKMNILLFAPGLLVALLHQFPSLRTLPYLLACAGVQLVLGAPFLLHAPFSYIRKAFELDRQFFYIWSVNLQFVPEHVFKARGLALALLSLHLLTLLLFCMRRWTSDVGGLAGLVHLRRAVPCSPERLVDLLFVSNFIGIVFSRTIHYQFYSWYAHSLPWLLLRTRLPIIVQLAVFALIELVYNIYPPRAWASATLTSMHLVLLVALYFTKQSRVKTHTT